MKAQNSETLISVKASQYLKDNTYIANNNQQQNR